MCGGALAVAKEGMSFWINSWEYMLHCVRFGLDSMCGEISTACQPYHPSRPQTGDKFCGYNIVGFISLIINLGIFYTLPLVGEILLGFILHVDRHLLGRGPWGHFHQSFGKFCNIFLYRI